MSAPAFPPSGTSLERYAAVLSAVEINSSFHRPHQRKTYERWAASVPQDFKFAVKVPKLITHARRMIDIDQPLAQFLEQAGGLGAKLAVVLVQLPPTLAFDLQTVSQFFEKLRSELSSDTLMACEPRHASWSPNEVDRCLAELRVARVVADPIILPDAFEPGGWQGLHYRRWHGSPRVYYSAYGHDRLTSLATTIKQDQQAGIQSWGIFDNTAAGHAANDAIRLEIVLNSPSENLRPA